MNRFKLYDWLTIVSLALLLVLFFAIYARCTEIENTLWEYQLDKPFELTEHYGFANDNVYWVDGNKAYEFPTRVNVWAFYDTIKSIAVMYNYYLGSQAVLISYFDKDKAIQIGLTNLMTPYVLEYKLTLIGDLF